MTLTKNKIIIPTLEKIGNNLNSLINLILKLSKTKLCLRTCKNATKRWSTTNSWVLCNSKREPCLNSKITCLSNKIKSLKANFNPAWKISEDCPRSYKSWVINCKNTIKSTWANNGNIFSLNCLINRTKTNPKLIKYPQHIIKTKMSTTVIDAPTLSKNFSKKEDFTKKIGLI